MSGCDKCVPEISSALAEAIKAGVGALLPYLASQIIVGMGLGMLFLIVVGVSAGIGLPWLAVIVAVLVGAPIMTRFALTAPVVAIERWRNPLAALRRAWQLTAGNTWRLLLFFGLILLAFLIIMSVITGLTGIIRTFLQSKRASGPAERGQRDEQLLGWRVGHVRELNGGDLDDDLAVLALGFPSLVDG